jgi:hypothetical protein
VQLLVTTRQRWLDGALPLLAWIGRRPLLGRLLAGAANLGMKLLRGRLLRRRVTAIALYTVADDGRATEVFRAGDGFAALGRVLAWTAIAAPRDLRGACSFTSACRPP